ncbi:hypothetical protein ACFFK0_26595 [Paenibacillus chartarius]|uniref:Uncharacterized protein n=1 Tax=Paenibacillus chartarius TaxID=747481 RepID=A0ABV6DTY5_9BACL
MNFLSVYPLDIGELVEQGCLRLVMGYSKGIQLIEDDESWKAMLEDPYFMEDLIQMHVVSKEAAYFVWKRDEEWVTTRCRFQDAPRVQITRKQRLLGRRESLVSTQYVEHDSDGQAYISYSHPSGLQ